MGGSVNAAEAAVRNAQGNAQGAAADQRQGVLGDRQVSGLIEGMAGLSLQERREADAVCGDAASRTSLSTRQAAVGSTSEGRGTADCLSRFLVTPDLEPTVLTNSQGVILFRGFRHGLLATSGLDLQLLQSLPDDQLASFCDKTDRWQDVRPSSHAERIRVSVLGVRSDDPKSAESFAEGFRLAATQYMARAMAAAALATDTQKCERALNGAAPYLHLCAVSLLKPVESKKSHLQQMKGLDQLLIHHFGTPPLSLRLRDPVDGEWRSAKVHINIRQFALSSFGEGSNWVSLGEYPHLRSRMALEEILGPIEDDSLGGDAGRRATAINGRALVLAHTLHSQDLRHDPAVPGEGAENATVEQSRAALAANRIAIATEFQSLNRKFHTLTEAGAQLKAMWAEHGDWPAGADGHLRAAALIALMAYNMGDVPLLSGTDTSLTERLDAEVKCLAMYADSHEGHLPPFDSRVQR